MTVEENKIIINKDDIFSVSKYIKEHSIVVIGIGLSITLLGVCAYIDNNKGAM